MKCKRCGCFLSPQEKDDVLQALAEGLKPAQLCEDCYEEESSMAYRDEYDDHSDADPGL